MHWLQALDTSLFHFINRSLSNPLCDWIMPVLSGGGGAMHWFVPILVTTAAVVLCFGNARARLCALTIIFIVALGDPLIVNTIKHAVGRTRPCIALADAITLLGCTESGSMPSAHAANWFAATMVAFLFYRRSLWFMLPMALAVSFSRVYNGVHYPSDVLAGAILGAGYAAAGVIGLQAAWNWIGINWFPLWHAQMPSLLNAERGVRSAESKTHNSANSALRTPHSEFEWLRLGAILIFAMLIGRWIYLASGAIELSQDEAYQWTWSKHLALSYYSKPPGIALIQFAGTSFFGDTEFGVRFFSPLFAAIVSLMLLRFLAREIGARPSFWLLLVATATPLLGIGTILMTIDPPLVLCWTWALVAGWRAMQPDGKTRDWLVVGLAMGLGFLCKYNAFYQIICFGIFFALWPTARIHLRKPGPWLALMIFLICTLPVVIWNSQHGWITAHHVAGNAGLNGQWHPTLRYFWDFLFSEFALLNPIFFVGAIWAMFGFWKLRRERPLWLYFFCMGAPVFLGHLLWSFHSRILPNWIAPAILPMFCLMVAYWNEKFRSGSRYVKPFFAAGVTLGIFAIAIMYQSNLIARIAGQPLPGEKDPSRRVSAWKTAATLAETEREKLAAGGKPAFIIAGHYGITGLDSFYIPQARAALKSEPLVYCVDSDESANQFYFWPEYDYRAHRKGQNAIYISEANLYLLDSDWLWKWLKHEQLNRTKPPSNTLPPRIAQEFESVTDLGEHDIMIGDRVFHREHLWACYNLK
jgi:4-amino-4-deoxy-L-arabinose transferase-like glycosyltransferase